MNTDNTDIEGVGNYRQLQHAHYMMLYTDIERSIVLHYAHCMVLYSAAHCT
jgi:hypothetical protein